MPAIYNFTTTVQDIIDAVSRDVRSQLDSTTTPDSNVLLDFCDRTSIEMLRASRWLFLLSPPKNFVTQVGVQNYWLGAIATGPSTALDTGLNLTDLRIVKPDSVFDRSNYRELKQVDRVPLNTQLTFADATIRLGRPTSWQQDFNNAQTLVLYPGPDNQNNYYPMPETPIVQAVAGGALPARKYRVTLTYVDSLGNESIAPRPTEIFLPASTLLRVSPPQAPTASAINVQYNRYNLYAGIDTGVGEFDEDQSICLLQTVSPISTTVSTTEPTSGLVTGSVAPPTTTTIEPVDGYVIEFQYYKKRLKLIDVSNTLQIPDDYRDILISGVAAKTFKFLGRPMEYQDERGKYLDGLRQMVRDTNWYPRTPDYINPDSASISFRSPSIGLNDLGTLF